MNRVAFFDVDGTLLPENISSIPESTLRAIRKLQEKDTGVVLCTGRHPLELKQLGLYDLGFDGFVLLNGQLVLDKDHSVLASDTIDGEDKEELLSIFHQKKYPMILVEMDRLYMNYHNDDVRVTQSEISSPVYDVGQYNDKDVYMATIFSRKEDRVEFSNLKVARWHRYASDIYSPDGGKVRGIKQFLKHVGVESNNTIAFGDGGNDIDMLKYCNVGIAMNWSPEYVKEAADYVADEEDGIEKALLSLGWI